MACAALLLGLYGGMLKTMTFGALAKSEASHRMPQPMVPSRVTNYRLAPIGAGGIGRRFRSAVSSSIRGGSRGSRRAHKTFETVKQPHRKIGRLDRRRADAGPEVGESHPEPEPVGATSDFPCGRVRETSRYLARAVGGRVSVG